MEPILAALQSDEIAEALRDYVLRKNGLNNTPVVAQVSYNTRNNGIIAAVSLTPVEAPAESRQAG